MKAAQKLTLLQVIEKIEKKRNEVEVRRVDIPAVGRYSQEGAAVQSFLPRARSPIAGTSRNFFFEGDAVGA